MGRSVRPGHDVETTKVPDVDSGQLTRGRLTALSARSTSWASAILIVLAVRSSCTTLPFPALLRLQDIKDAVQSESAHRCCHHAY